MAIGKIGNEVYTGLSTDAKPSTGLPVGARFIETDTPNTFTWTGYSWLPSSIFPSAGRRYGTRAGFVGGAGALQAEGSGTGKLAYVTAGNNQSSINMQTNSTDGDYGYYASGTSNNKARCGWWGGCNVYRKFNPTFTIRFRLSQTQTGGQGIMYVGLVNSAAQPAAGTSVLDTFLNTKQGVLFGFRSSENTFMIMSNNAQTLATYTVAGTPNASATDTNTHTLSISLRDSVPQAEILWSYDGTQMTAITDTTNCVPASTTALTPIFILEAQTATGLSLVERWSEISEDAP